MPIEDAKPLKLFYCYTHVDKALRDELDLHLTSLKRRDLISSWYDGEITPGDTWEEEIDRQLKSAHLILLLITPHFIASEYCYSIEMKHALERHQAGTACVIPVILRYTFWQGAPFSTIQALPTDAKPLSEWMDRDKAFWDITIGIHKAIQKLKTTQTTPRELVDNGNALKKDGEGSTTREQALHRSLDVDILKRQGITLYLENKYEGALAAYEQALSLDPANVDIWRSKKHLLEYNLKRYEEALAAYEQVLHLDPANVSIWQSKGRLLKDKLKRYEEALAAYEQALHLDSSDASIWQSKGILLHYTLRRYEEALAAYEQVLHLDPTNTIWKNKVQALESLNRYEEVLTTYEQALHLDPTNADIRKSRGQVLQNLNRDKEALAAHKQTLHFTDF